MKFDQTQFPAKEMIQAPPDLVPLSDHQIPELDNESDSLGLGLVKLAQPPTRPPSPGQSAPRQPVSLSQPSLAPPAVSWKTRALTAPLQPPTPHYLLCPTKDRLARESQARPSMESINHTMIHMFQEVPNSYREAMNLLDKDKWLKASKEELGGLTKMGHSIQSLYMIDTKKIS